jgi:hypothetical protein
LLLSYPQFIPLIPLPLLLQCCPLLRLLEIFLLLRLCLPPLLVDRSLRGLGGLPEEGNGCLEAQEKRQGE